MVPGPVDPINVYSQLGGNSSVIIPFRNPTDRQVTVDVIMKERLLSRSGKCQLLYWVSFDQLSYVCSEPMKYRFFGVSEQRNTEMSIECVRSCDQKPYLHNETEGGICIKIEFNPQNNISLLQHGRRFFVYSSNMAAVTSCEHTLFLRALHFMTRPNMENLDFFAFLCCEGQQKHFIQSTA